MAYYKYRNKRVADGNLAFDSIKEYQMYRELKLMEKAGEIRDLKLQPRFVLQEGYTRVDGRKVRPITYTADFSLYDNKLKRFRVIDCKGYKTQVFRLKEKMFNKIMKDELVLEYEI